MCSSDLGRIGPRSGGLQEGAGKETSQKKGEEDQRKTEIEAEQVKVHVDEAGLAGKEGDTPPENAQGNKLLAVHGSTWKLASLG